MLYENVKYKIFSLYNNKRVILFAGGSSGSVFLHSLINGCEGIFCLPVIFNAETISRNLAKNQTDLFHLLEKKSKLDLVFNKVATDRHGDFSSFQNFDLDRFKKVLGDIEKISYPKSVKGISNIAHYAYSKATNIPISKSDIIFEHPHNLSKGVIKKFLAAYDKPIVLLTVRSPVAQVNSFFSYQIKNQCLTYDEITKRLIALMEVTLEYLKNRSKVNLVRLEDLHSKSHFETSRIAKLIGLKNMEGLRESQFGNMPYVAQSPNNGVVSGFKTVQRKKNTSKISKDDERFIQFLFFEQYQLFCYDLPKTAVSSDILDHDFLGIKPEISYKKNLIKQTRKKLLLSKKAEIKREMKN